MRSRVSKCLCSERRLRSRLSSTASKGNEPLLYSFKVGWVCTHGLELLTLVFLQLAVVAAVCVFTEGAVAHDMYPEVACIEITSGPLVGSHIGMISGYRRTRVMKSC